MDKTDKAIPTGIKHPSIRTPRIPADASMTESVLTGSAPTSAPSAPLAGRAIAVQSLALAAGGLILVYLIFAVHQFLGAQSLYEAVQQQRILNQRYAKEVLLAASGVPVNYEKTAREWTQATDLLTQGGMLHWADNTPPQKVQPPVDASRFKASMAQMVDVRQKIIQEAKSYLDSAQKNDHRAQLFDELYRQSLELQAAGDALVETYDKHLDSGVSWWDVNAVAIEMAERQRMLIQQHIKEVLFVAHGIPADYQATRLRLYESAKILSEGGQISVDSGETITIPAPGGADLRFNLEQQKNALDRFTAVSNQYLMMSNEEVERSIQLKKILDLTGDYHGASTQLLSQYRSFFEGKVKRAGREAGAAGILMAVFVLLLGWAFINKYVDAPVAQLTALLRGLRTGAKEPTPAAPVTGPLGEMSAEVHLFARQWQSRQNWFDQFLTADDAAQLEDPGSHDPVASRVYQWYKSRGSEIPASRWSSEEKGESDITIIGRLPDVEPSAKDSELLDQLIQRANELQVQHENISLTRDRLAEEAEALRASEAGLTEENHRLRTEKETHLAQASEQLEELIQLRIRLEGLQKSEAAISAGTDEIRRVNSELLASIDRQSDELRVLRGQLQAKVREFETVSKDSRRQEEAHQIQIADLSRRLTEAESLRARLETELKALTHTHQEEQASALRKLEILRAEQASAFDASRSEHASKLESLLSEHAGSLESLRSEQSSKFETLHAEHASTLESMRSEHAAKIESMRLEHEAALESTRSEHAVTLESLRSEHASALEAARSQYVAAAQLADEVRGQMTHLQHELSQASQNARRDQEALTTLRNLLDSAETGLADLRATVERSTESARQDAQAREALVQRISTLSERNVDLEAIGAEQLRQIHRQEAVIAELQQALARQTRALEALRVELSETLSRHSEALEAGGVRLRQSEIQISQTQSQLVETQTGLLDARTQLAETKTALENRESDLWRVRKELSDHQRELSDAKQAIERLKTVESQQTSTMVEMRYESSRLQSILASKTLALNELEEKRRELENKFAQMEAEYTDTRRRLEEELTSSRDAHQSKCQALALMEERLSTTRNALKSALDELQEQRSNR